MKKKILLFILLFIPFMINAEEVNIKDGKQIKNFSYIYEIIDSNDGGYIVGGAGNDNYGYIGKYDSSFNLMWNSNYSKLSISEFTDIALDKDDNVIAIGYSSDEDSTFFSIIKKYDTEGNLLWEKESSQMYFQALQIVDDGYVIIGNYTKTNNDTDAFILKYDKVGNIVWQSNFGGNYRDSFKDIEAVNDEYIVLGYSGSDLEGLDMSCTDSFLIKYNDAGKIIWKTSRAGYGYEEDDGYFCESNNTIHNFNITKNGDILVVGNMGILTFSMDGNIKNEKLFSGEEEHIYHILNDGYITIYNGDSGKENYDVYIKKYDYNGVLKLEEKKSFDKPTRFINLLILDDETVVAFLDDYSSHNYFFIDTEYNIKINNIESNGTSIIEQQGKYGIVKPTPNEGYEVDEIIVKDVDGNVLDVEVVANEDGTYSFPLYTDVSVEVLFKEKLVNPKTGVSSFIGIIFTLLLIGISGFFMIKNCNNSYEL